MSDKPISVGDLVMAVRGKPCCGYGSSYGATYRVTSIDVGEYTCAGCGARYTSTGCRGYWGPDMAWNGFEMSRLKRIDPPADAISEDARVRKPAKEPQNA